MTGAIKIYDGSRDHDHAASGWSTVNLTTKFEVYISTCYKGGTNRIKLDGLRYFKVIQDGDNTNRYRAHTSSY